MEQLLTLLAERVCRESIVASRNLANGMQLVVYPIANGALIALGYGRERANGGRVDSVLRMRTENPERFGAWLPALFGDGSWYMVRRIEHDNPGSGMRVPSAEELRAALELLA